MTDPDFAGIEPRHFLYAIDVDLDFDAQLHEVRLLLSSYQRFAAKHAKSISELAEFARASEGYQADIAVEDWVGAMHRSVYQSGAHSLAAVGMLAPFLESALALSFEAIGQRLTVKENSSRAMGEGHFWNCRQYQKSSGKWTRDFVRGTLQLSDAIGLGPHLPADTHRTLAALFSYRNLVFHHGLEWPVVKRVHFLGMISKGGWNEWFRKSETDGQPRIFYVTDAFVEHCYGFSERILDALGEFVLVASKDGRLRC